MAQAQQQNKCGGWVGVWKVLPPNVWVKACVLGKVKVVRQVKVAGTAGIRRNQSGVGSWGRGPGVTER